jgi:mannose-6-phosphate isomerase-like protein (cupin superfamily)
MNKIFVNDIETSTLSNKNYRKVLHTTKSKNMQLVLMSLKPNEEIGMEVHEHVDQFFRIEQGDGVLLIYKQTLKKIKIYKNDVIIIPAGTYHNIINIGKKDLKLYTIYTPANHKDKLVQKIKTD